MLHLCGRRQIWSCEIALAHTTPLRWQCEVIKAAYDISLCVNVWSISSCFLLSLRSLHIVRAHITRECVGSSCNLTSSSSSICALMCSYVAQGEVLLQLSSPSPPDSHPGPLALWLDIRRRSVSLCLPRTQTRTRTQSEVGPQDQCETKDRGAEGAPSNQGHAPGGEETLSSLSNLDVLSHKRSQKEPDMATCLAENTVRAISSTRKHTCSAKGMMMREEFAGFGFWLCVLQWN